MATDSVTDLVRQLQILNTCSLDDDISHLTLENNEQSLEINSKVTEKLNAYLTAVKENEKIIDPAIKKQREKLPIFQEKNKLIETIQSHQVLIIIGETGSGKTTQIPQYMLEAGIGVSGRIGCTQLRRMAAKAVAKRVAFEQGCKVGDEVGYTIRFEDCSNEKTKIQYMTDGILIRECTYDRMLNKYAAIILDESHERTIDTDVLLAVLKWVLKKRNDLKLIISSATLDSEKFSAYFFDAAVYHISGRMFPVEIIYEPCYPYSYEDRTLQVVSQINKMDKGDILVFLTGEDDIEYVADKLMDYQCSLYPELEVLPCYSALPWEQQRLIFEESGKNKRKVILATNIAETSLTVDGIRYVIDSGYVKQKVYDPKREIEVLKKIRVSQAQAIQRSGRAGRTAPGKCYRLYSKFDFDSLISGQDPEIKRSSLSQPVLLLKKMGFNDLYEFDFLDSPPKENLEDAIEELTFFDALDRSTGLITETGKKMASFPLDPNLAKMLILSQKLRCSEDILTIVALLSVPNIFYKPKKKRNQANIALAKFGSIHGDLVMMLNVYNQWILYNDDSKWCSLHFVRDKIIREAHSVRQQILDIMNTHNMMMVSSLPNMTPILKCICAGFFQNVAQKRLNAKNHAYTTLPKQEIVYIHPGSTLFKRSEPLWVVYQKIVTTSKEYMRGITPIEVVW